MGVTAFSMLQMGNMTCDLNIEEKFQFTVKKEERWPPPPDIRSNIYRGTEVEYRILSECLEIVSTKTLYAI